MTTTPRMVAQQLAHSARQLNEAINTVLATEDYQGPWHQHLTAFRQTLLPHLTSAEFADMYAQTIVCSLFAIHLLQDATPTAKTPNTPRAHCFAPCVPWQFTIVDDRIASLIDNCTRLLEDTDMANVLRDFGKATMQQDPVVHFYEDFLAAYAPRIREMRGVYYTPEPVVSYIVRSVDELLQTHFGKPMGLADSETIILDPATGTATFLHAVILQIYTRLQSIGMADRWDQYVPNTLLPRLLGFELLMAPYTVAHLNLHMLLQQLGYTVGSNDRLGMYLTNALFDTPPGQQPIPSMPFAPYADAVEHSKPVMLVLGNPPYSANSANRGIGEQPIRTHYYPKDSIREQNPKLLLDDYVKFLRLGQGYIEDTGRGILAFITNHGYLDNPTFRGMRESLMQTFNIIYVLNLHGNVKKRETAPDGSKDENIFAIQQGVSIGIFVKDSQQQHHQCDVYYADLWGMRGVPDSCTGKYPWLASHTVATTSWQRLSPQAPFFLFIPYNSDLLPHYEQGWKITDVFERYSSGIKTHRDHFVLDYDRQALEQRITAFRDCTIPDATIQQHYRLNDTRDWKLHQRRQFLHADQAWMHHFTHCLYRPFDRRHIYYHKAVVERGLYDTMQHLCGKPNIGLITVRQIAETHFNHVLATDCIAACRVTFSNKGAGYVFPLYCYSNDDERSDLCDAYRSTHSECHNSRRPNLSVAFISEVERRLGLAFVADGMGDLATTVGPEDIFHYIYAVLHSPTYRAHYAEFLRIDFPRIPIVDNKDLFAILAAYGADLVDLHVLRVPSMGGVGGAGGAAILLHPAEQGVTQCHATAGPIDAVVYDAQRQHVLLGPGSDSYFAGVDSDTWAMQIGGYQPLHKWLKDRKGRTLSFDDVLHYMRMVVALRETRRIMAEIGAWCLL